MTETDDRFDPRGGRHAGDVIVLANFMGTMAFADHGHDRRDRLHHGSQWVGAITAMSLFAVGVFAFLWSFWNVVQRSRAEVVGVTQVYLLLGTPTPGRVRVRMLALLAVQIVVGLGTALSRTETADGRAGIVARPRCARPDVRYRAERAVGRVPRHVSADPGNESVIKMRPGCADRSREHQASRRPGVRSARMMTHG